MNPIPSLFETTGCLCLAARRASRAITREFDQALRAHGLRATQFTLLSALHLAGPKSMGDLAELLSADRTTLTRNLAVAEHNAWVTLRPDRDDARSRIAAITAKGSRALEAALPTWRKTQRKLLDDIGDEAAASLRRLAGGPCAVTPPSHMDRKREPVSKSQPAIRHRDGPSANT
ncbi:MAG TPA: MarR family winged helix-turn-helix transcriptional regulator [Rhodanobacteraceae bacterium]|nr:MarR family winged helix-turn-helix transcriptional regulator [Rhodanobacteraceae bacterium]